MIIEEIKQVLEKRRPWKVFYDTQPYLQILSIDNLYKRLEGLLDNVICYNWEGFVYIKIDNNEIGNAFIDAIYEFENRRIDFWQTIILKIDWYKTKAFSFNIRKINEVVNAINGKNVLVKYVNHQHVKFWRDGNIRFGVASSYDKDILAKAIQDDEHKISQQINGLWMKLERLGNTEDVSKNRIDVIDGKIEVMYPYQYYICSFAIDVDPKLFALFGYDSCVIIENYLDYLDCALKTISKKDNVFKVHSRIVEYIDENRQLKQKANLPFQKTYSYKYQNEYRFTIELEKDSDKLDLIYKIEDLDLKTYIIEK
jgi:hypothetical protein